MRTARPAEAGRAAGGDAVDQEAVLEGDPHVGPVDGHVERGLRSVRCWWAIGGSRTGLAASASYAVLTWCQSPGSDRVADGAVLGHVVAGDLGVPAVANRLGLEVST